MASNPPPLPHTAWHLITSHLSSDLTTLLALSSSHPSFQDFCRPHISAFFSDILHPIAPLSRTHYYHSLLWLILAGHSDPGAIREFYYTAQYQVSPPPFEPTGTTRPGLGFLLPAQHPEADSSSNATLEIDIERSINHFDSLLHKAVQTSPWIPQDLTEEVLTRIHQGDNDATLAILLPLCTGLKVLEIPGRGELCAAIFCTIGDEYARRGTDAVEARARAKEAARRDRDSTTTIAAKQSPPEYALPFSELLVLYLSGHQHGYSLPLPCTLPYLALPSLQRAVLTSLRDQTFPSSRPAKTLNLTCPEIYFQQSSVSRRAALAFAEAVAAPCEIRHWFERPRSDILGMIGEGADDIDGPAWDRILVRSDADGRREIEARLDERGGNPGYDYAWVSWLWRGKMLDWRRMDETFEGEEGDGEEEFLQGMLG